MSVFRGWVQKTSGFTITEVLVVIAIMSLMSLTIGNAITSFYRYNASTLAQTYEIDNARRGLDQLVRDVREMTYADDGTFPLAVMEDHQIGFYSDIDRDDSVEYVEYELASTTLYKRVYTATGSPPVYDLVTPEATTTVSQYVQNVDQGSTTFGYYIDIDTVATSTTLLTDIRYVTVLLVVNVDPIANPGEFTIRSSAAPRNLKDNL